MVLPLDELEALLPVPPPVLLPDALEVALLLVPPVVALLLEVPEAELLVPLLALLFEGLADILLPALLLDWLSLADWPLLLFLLLLPLLQPTKATATMRAASKAQMRLNMALPSRSSKDDGKARPVAFPAR